MCLWTESDIIKDTTVIPYVVVSLETPHELKMRLTASDIILGSPQKGTTEGDITEIAWRHHIN